MFLLIPPAHVLSLFFLFMSILLASLWLVNPV
jgi:hypothetical protein